MGITSSWLLTSLHSVVLMGKILEYPLTGSKPSFGMISKWCSELRRKCVGYQMKPRPNWPRDWSILQYAWGQIRQFLYLIKSTSTLLIVSDSSVRKIILYTCIVPNRASPDDLFFRSSEMITELFLNFRHS